MARNENPPLERGKTYFDGRPTDATSGANLEGKEWIWEDPYGSGRSVVTKILRNVSGATLMPGRFVVNDAATAAWGTRTPGYYYASTDLVIGVVDEQLGSAGVPNNDLFWAVIGGPTQVRTASSGSVSLALGGRVGPSTGTSRTNADAGRIAIASPSAGAEVGYAEAASTTNDALLPIFLRPSTVVGP